MFFKLLSKVRFNLIMLRILQMKSLRSKKKVKMVIMKIKNILKEIFYQNLKKKDLKMHLKKISKIKDLQGQKY
jgi:hypothetical protein